MIAKILIRERGSINTQTALLSCAFIVGFFFLSTADQFRDIQLAALVLGALFVYAGVEAYELVLNPGEKGSHDDTPEERRQHRTLAHRLAAVLLIVKLPAALFLIVLLHQLDRTAPFWFATGTFLFVPAVLWGSQELDD